MPAVFGLADDFMAVRTPVSEDPLSEFKAAIDAARAEGWLRGYAIVTDRPELYFKDFISNNVVDAADEDAAVKAVKWILSGFKSASEDDVFFCSDFHFNHKNIIKYCGRPWNSGVGEDGALIVTDEDVARMNEDLVKNFNETVPPDATTWFLGDFCLGPDQKKMIPEFVSRLNGKINIVLGNHDHHSVKFYYDAGFNRVYDRSVLIRDFVVLSHAPLEFVKEPFFNIYGHVHDCRTYRTICGSSCCVCVERHGYRPVPLSWIKAEAEKFIEEGEKCQ